MTDSDVRATVARLAVDRRRSLASLSRQLGRNPAYLQQFIARGSPRRLGEHERGHLARLLAIDERELGAREPWRPKLGNEL